MPPAKHTLSISEPLIPHFVIATGNIGITEAHYHKFDRLGEKLHLEGMSAQEINAELPKLDPAELRLIKDKLLELEAAASPTPKTGWGAGLLEIAGSADDLPADLSINHDHYLYGTPKRQ